MSGPTEEPWPDDVLARYLTAGGALIDLVEDTDAIEATCHACPTPTSYSHPFDRIAYDHTDSGTEDYVLAVDRVAEWARSHAESCRAVPRPPRAGVNHDQ